MFPISSTSGATSRTLNEVEAAPLSSMMRCEPSIMPTPSCWAATARLRLMVPDSSAPPVIEPLSTGARNRAPREILSTQQALAERVGRIDTSGLPAVGDDASIPRDAPKRTIADVRLPEPRVEPAESPAPPFEAEAPPDNGAIAPEVPDIGAIAPLDGRLDRIRGRLAKSPHPQARAIPRPRSPRH